MSQLRVHSVVMFWHVRLDNARARELVLWTYTLNSSLALGIFVFNSNYAFVISMNLSPFNDYK